MPSSQSSNTLNDIIAVILASGFTVTLILSPRVAGTVDRIRIFSFPRIHANTSDSLYPSNKHYFSCLVEYEYSILLPLFYY